MLKMLTSYPVRVNANLRIVICQTIVKERIYHGMLYKMHQEGQKKA